MKIRNKIISSILFFVLALSFMLFGCKSNDNDEILYIAPDLNCFPPSLGIDQMWRMYENGSIKNSIIISNVYLTRDVCGVEGSYIVFSGNVNFLDIVFDKEELMNYTLSVDVDAYHHSAVMFEKNCQRK